MEYHLLTDDVAIEFLNIMKSVYLIMVPVFLAAVFGLF